MAHSVIDTPTLGEADNRYGPTAARLVSTEPIRLRTMTVDCHAHVFVPEAAKYIAPYHDPAALPFGKYSSPQTRAINLKQDADRTQALLNPTDRVQVLDAQGIDIQIVSPAPPQCYYDVPKEHGRTVSRIVNEGVATFVATHPERFAGLGTIPLQDPAAAVSELEFVVGTLDFRGVEILTNVNGIELSSAEFDPVWAKASEIGAVVMLHPLGFTEARRFEDYYFTNVIGNPLDTTVALHHLIFGGVLERHPDLKILAVHGGGFLPAYSGRIDHAWGARADARGSLPEPPSSYLAKMYFDTTVFTSHQLEYLVRQYSSDHILMGTDYPYDMAEYYPLQHVVSAAALSDREKANVAGESSVRFFGLSPRRT
jgi:aminocarboxymuconate-semialdehyde decarboxylase